MHQARPDTAGEHTTPPRGCRTMANPANATALTPPVVVETAEFGIVIHQVRLAAAAGPPSHKLLEQAFRLATTFKLQQEVANAAWPKRAVGETAKLFEPLLNRWKLDDGKNDDDTDDDETDDDGTDDDETDDAGTSENA